MSDTVALQTPKPCRHNSQRLNNLSADALDQRVNVVLTASYLSKGLANMAHAPALEGAYHVVRFDSECECSAKAESKGQSQGDDMNLYLCLILNLRIQGKA